MPDSPYPQPDGRPRLFTFHAPATAYAYVIAEATKRGVSRNKALTEIIGEHEDAALKREARRKR